MENGAVYYAIKDKHTGLYIRLTDPDDVGIYEVELTDKLSRATYIAGWGYALNAAMATDIPFELVRVL